jgi:hypothetical protein
VAVIPRLAFARRRTEALMPERCEVMRPVVLADDAGGATETLGSVASVACAVVPLDVQPWEDTAGGRVTAETLWHIHMPAGTDVEASDRIVQTHTRDPAGAVVALADPRTFEVLPSGGARTREAKRLVRCREVR